MSETFGIQVNYRNGNVDWFDPCTEFPEDVNGYYIIDNGCYTYEVVVDSVKDIFKYSLCKVCDYDPKTFDCTENYCNNPRYIN